MSASSLQWPPYWNTTTVLSGMPLWLLSPRFVADSVSKTTHRKQSFAVQASDPTTQIMTENVRKMSAEATFKITFFAKKTDHSIMAKHRCARSRKRLRIAYPTGALLEVFRGWEALRRRVQGLLAQLRRVLVGMPGTLAAGVRLPDFVPPDQYRGTSTQIREQALPTVRRLRSLFAISCSESLGALVKTRDVRFSIASADLCSMYAGPCTSLCRNMCTTCSGAKVARRDEISGSREVRKTTSERPEV